MFISFVVGFVVGAGVASALIIFLLNITLSKLEE